MLTLKIQAKDYELTLLFNKLKTDPSPKQSQDQSLFQAEHVRPKSCYIYCSILYFAQCHIRWGGGRSQEKCGIPPLFAGIFSTTPLHKNTERFSLVAEEGIRKLCFAGKN